MPLERELGSWLGTRGSIATLSRTQRHPRSCQSYEMGAGNRKGLGSDHWSGDANPDETAKIGKLACRRPTLTTS